MNYINVIVKFSQAYNVSGHYLLESSRIVTIWEQDGAAHEILRRNQNKLDEEGNVVFEEENNKYGAIITTIPNVNGFYIIVLESSKLKAVNNHWKRIRKGIFKVLPFNDLLEKSSIETRIIEQKNQFINNLDKIAVNFQ